MKRLSIAGAIAVLLAVTALAQSGIDAEGVANGTTVLWFSGTKVTASIDSDFSVSGSLEIEGRTVAFTAFGTAFGAGAGDSAALTFDVWIVIEATGTTDDGEPLSLRGGMAGSGEDTDLSASAFGLASGPFFFLVTLGTDPYRAGGTAAGSAAGAFVVPDDPQTMQIEGTGTYTLIGELVGGEAFADGEDGQPDYLAHLPWDPASWPDELLNRLLVLLREPCCEPDDDREGEPVEAV